jgi:hypothetical protein
VAPVGIHHVDLVVADGAAACESDPTTIRRPRGGPPLTVTFAVSGRWPAPSAFITKQGRCCFGCGSPDAGDCRRGEHLGRLRDASVAGGRRVGVTALSGRVGRVAHLTARPQRATLDSFHAAKPNCLRNARASPYAPPDIQAVLRQSQDAQSSLGEFVRENLRS